MTTTTDQAAPIVMRYRNQSGALITVTEVGSGLIEPSRVLIYAAQCSGCLEEKGTTQRPEPMNSVRPWAADHAATCQALPQVEAEPQPVSAVYLAEAQRLIDTARGLAEHATATEQQRTERLLAVARSVTSFALAAHQIETRRT